MTNPLELERRAMFALGRGAVSYLPASFDKRFARNMAALANHVDYTLTDRQRWLLWRMVYRYRRQIGRPELLAEAVKHEHDPEPPPARPFSNRPKRLDPPKWLRRK